MKTILLVIIFSVVLVLLGKWTCRRPFNKRELKSDEELYSSFKFCASVDFSICQRVMRLVGHCYAIPVGKLRPDDSFHGNLGRADSWSLGDGAEKLTKQLQKEFSITLTQSECKQIMTIQNLIESIASRVTP